jgi:hypothetical protein
MEIESALAEQVGNNITGWPKIADSSFDSLKTIASSAMFLRTWGLKFQETRRAWVRFGGDKS